MLKRHFNCDEESHQEMTDSDGSGVSGAMIQQFDVNDREDIATSPKRSSVCVSPFSVHVSVS